MTISTAEFRRRLEGVSAVPVCAFNHSGDLNLRGCQDQAAFLRDSGVDAIVPCGNTSEYYSLTVEESMLLAEATQEVIDGSIPTIVGVGHDLTTAIRLAHHAEGLGADGIMIHQPNQPFADKDGVVKYISAIAQSVGIDVILYVRRDVLGIKEYKKLFELPNIIAVKHASNDVHFAGKLIAETRDYGATWICGSAEGWAPFYSLIGSKGFTSGLANVFPELTLTMRDALKSGDFESAMKVWHSIHAFEAMRAKDSNAYNVSVIKAAMNLIGRNGGIVREPASNLPQQDLNALRQILEGWESSRHDNART